MPLSSYKVEQRFVVLINAQDECAAIEKALELPASDWSPTGDGEPTAEWVGTVEEKQADAGRDE